MNDREVKVRLGWFNIFNLAGALYGWCHTHTWQGTAWGFAAGTVGPPLFLLVCFTGALIGTKLVDNWPTPKVRISDDIREETQDARWEREYREHCDALGLPNELGTCKRQERYYASATEESTTASHSSHHYTSGGGPG